MTGPTDASDVVSTDAVPGSVRHRLAPLVVAFGALGLIVLAATEAGPTWVHGLTSVAAAVTAMVVLLTAELRWAKLVSTAQSAGLVAAPARARA